LPEAPPAAPRCPELVTTPLETGDSDYLHFTGGRWMTVWEANGMNIAPKIEVYDPQQKQWLPIPVKLPQPMQLWTRTWVVTNSRMVAHSPPGFLVVDPVKRSVSFVAAPDPPPEDRGMRAVGEEVLAAGFRFNPLTGELAVHDASWYPPIFVRLRGRELGEGTSLIFDPELPVAACTWPVPDVPKNRFEHNDGTVAPRSSVYRTILGRGSQRVVVAEQTVQRCEVEPCKWGDTTTEFKATLLEWR
jgi:hypothetical protein